MNIKNIKIFKKLSIISLLLLSVSLITNINACDNKSTSDSQKLSYLLHLPTDMKKIISMHLLKIETNLENFKDHFDEILSGIQALKNLTQINKHFNNFINSSEFIELIANSFYKKTNNILLSTLLANKIASAENNVNNTIISNWLENKLKLNADLIKSIQDHMLILFISEYVKYDLTIPKENIEKMLNDMFNDFKITTTWELLKNNNSIKDFLLKELIANIELIPDNCFTGEVIITNPTDDSIEYKNTLINELITNAVGFADLKLIKSLLKHYYENNKVYFLINTTHNKNINNELIDLFLPNKNENLNEDTQETIHQFLVNLGIIGNINIATKILSYVKNIDYSININNCRITCLRNAMVKNHLPMIKFLLEHGANANFKIEGNISLLMATIYLNSNIKIIKLLLQHGANVNLKNNNNITALMLAIKANNIKIVKLLLKHGADINAENNGGETALSIAQENNFDDIVELLESKKSDK